MDSQDIVGGTGFVLSPNLVVTYAHVVKDCNTGIGELLTYSSILKKPGWKQRYYVMVGTRRRCCFPTIE